MHRTLSRTFAAALAAALLAGALSLPGAGEETAPPPPAKSASTSTGSRLVVMYAGDPLTHTLNLADGTYGAHIAGTALVETQAHLDYGNYNDDALTIALDDDDRGVFTDIGHWADVARAYDFEEADGGGIGFASISYDGNEIQIARRIPKDSFQKLREGRPILGAPGGERRASLHPVPGHVYLARVEDRHRRKPSVHAKILVISHVPGDHVVLRWDRIPGL